MTDFFQYSTDQLKKIRDNFVVELVKASQGTKSSLSYIKNPLPQKSFIKNGETFQVMVFGGSVFKKALIKKVNNNLVILKCQKNKLPVFKNKITFLNFANKHIYAKVKTVAINFAYPIKPCIEKGIPDGILLRGTKENRFSKLINKKIGVQLEEYVFQKREKKITFSVANDTICLLLSDLTFRQRSCIKHAIVAGIVGAGTNFSFFIDEKIAVNIESGNFNKFPQSETGKIIDKSSTNPVQHLFEKEVSGAYLYQHFNLLEKNQRLKSTFELSQYAQSDLRGQMQSVVTAQNLFKRSASLVACQIAGIYEFKKQTIEYREWKIDVEDRRLKTEKNQLSTFHRQNPPSTSYPLPSKITFIMEGSVFWNGWHYQQFVRNYLEKLDINRDAIEFIKINNSSLIGAAKLVSI